jgi:hypothetical protein
VGQILNALIFTDDTVAAILTEDRFQAVALSDSFHPTEIAERDGTSAQDQISH